MHYDSVENAHGLKHDPFKALIVPRPIGWISTVDDKGICNLAPYSFFNAIGDRPHYVMFSSAGVKDSARNAEATGSFTCSLATWDTRHEMNVSSAPIPADQDEYPIAGLTAVASKFVKPPRVKESPAAFECRYWKTLELPDVDQAAQTGHYVVIGQVIGIYIDDAYIRDGLVDTAAMQPIARMGYMDYAVVREENRFTLNRPEMNADGQIKSKEAAAWDGTYR